MSNKKLPMGLVLVVLAHSAGANPMSSLVYAQVRRAAYDVRAAFYRSQSRMDPSSGARPPAPASSSALFPGFGILPQVPGLSLSVSQQSTLVSSVCLKYSTNSAEAAAAATGALYDSGYTVSSRGCGVPGGAQLGNSAQPYTVYGSRTLDSQDVPSYSLLKESGMTYSGPALAAFINPTKVLRAPPGAPGDVLKLSFYNPPTVSSYDASGVAYCDVRGVSSRQLRSGFTLVDNCQYVPPGGTCDMLIQYNGVPGTDSPSRSQAELSLGFSDGGFLQMNLLGEVSTAAAAQAPISSASTPAFSLTSYTSVPCAAAASAPSAGAVNHGKKLQHPPPGKGPRN
jgi:hypothetical protein